MGQSCSTQASTLHEMAMMGNHKGLRIAALKGRDLKARDGTGRTIAHWAAANGDYRLIRWAHKKGVPLDSTDNSGAMPQHVAAGEGRVEVLQWICSPEHGGQPINCLTKDSRTVAHVAAEKLRMDVLQKAHTLGVPFDVPDKDGNLPLHLCLHSQEAQASSQSIEALRWIAARCDPNAKGQSGWTIPHFAAWKFREDVLEVAKELKMPLRERDTEGRTPYQVLVESFHIHNTEPENALKWLLKNTQVEEDEHLEAMDKLMEKEKGEEKEQENEMATLGWATKKKETRSGVVEALFRSQAKKVKNSGLGPSAYAVPAPSGDPKPTTRSSSRSSSPALPQPVASPEQIDLDM